MSADITSSQIEASADPARAPTSSVHTTDEAKSRVKARAKANGRLKLYGLLAIGFAVGALVLLLWSVVERALKTTTEHYAIIEMTIPANDVDPENIAAADFGGMVKDQLKASFPSASSRRERRQLYGLISDGGADDLRAAAIAGEMVYDTPVERPLLVSDDADLYLRGEFGELVTLDANGALELSDEGKTITLSAPDGTFREVIAAAKAELRTQSDTLRRQAARQQTGIAVLVDRSSDLTGQEAEDTKAQIAGFTAKRDQLIAQADALDAQVVSQSDAPLALTPRVPSFFVKVNGGVLKLTSVAMGNATAVPMIPLESAATTDEWLLKVMETPEVGRTRMTDLQISILEDLRQRGKITEEWNERFFSKGDSREPELAGIRGAIVGSLLTMAITFLIAFPTGVLAAIYLEEFAPKNRLTDFIEVNINNLAAVPSIVFGLLGVGVFLWLMPDLRSTPLVGGIVLALMTLPTIVIASRAALKAVPPSIRAAALGLGASRMQTVFHHVLPLAMPGILTGSIIGMAQALGETAPLLLIGMVAFITSVPEGVMDSATVLPVQVFIWANQSETAFDYRTAAAIVVLLGFLIVMNLLAIVLRKRFERRW